MQFAVVPDPKLGFESWRMKDLERAVEAVAFQTHEHVAPTWGWDPPEVEFCKTYEDVPAGAILVLVARNGPGSVGLLGRHEQRGVPVGRVFVDPIFAVGGDVITGEWSVSKVLSHEILEIYGNPQANLWAMMPTGKLTPRELCDAVESDYATVQLSDGFMIPVSNFLLPAWFDHEDLGAETKYDWGGTLKMPFSIAAGGYVALYGEPHLFGSKVPDWRRDHVQEASRLSRMGSANVRTSTPDHLEGER